MTPVHRVHLGLSMALVSAFLVLLALLFPRPGRSQDSQPMVSGLEVMRRAEDLLYRLKDQTADVNMKITQPNGHEHRHTTRWFWKNFDRRGGIESKAIFYTRFPPSKRGEAFLIWDYAQPGKPDDLWLYLPEQRQTRRLTTRDRHESFQGSDLTFEDMGQRQLDLEHHRIVREEPCEGQGSTCYVVESVPLETEGPYGRRLSWVVKGQWTTLKVEFFDRQAMLLKTQTVGWKEQDGLHLWISTRVINHQTGSRTVLDVNDLTANTGVPDERFDLRALTRLR